MTRKPPEIQFPLSFWPHAAVQAALVLVVLLSGWEAGGFFQNLAWVASSAGTGLILVLWGAFLLLICEILTRSAQDLALRIMPSQDALFRILSGILAIFGAYAGFVLLLAVLSRVLGTYQIASWGHIPFHDICWRMFLEEAPLLSLFALGEALRQVIFASAISQWREAVLLRRKPITLPDEHA